MTSAFLYAGKHYPHLWWILLLMMTPFGTALAAGGDLLWKFNAGGGIFGAPAIGPLGEVVFGARDGVVYSLNPDGTERWTFNGSGDWIESSPTIDADGTVYVGSWDGFLYALDGANGSEKWRFETAGVITGSVALTPQGVVVCASEDGMVYGVDSQTGTGIWTFLEPRLFAPISASPVLSADGSVAYVGNEAGQFHAIDTQSGSLRWTFSVSATHAPSGDANPAIKAAAAINAAGSLFVSSYNGRLYHLSPAGGLIWSFAATEPISASPVLTSDGMVVVPSHDGYVYFIDAASGIQVDEVYVGDVFYCTPAVDAAGNILIGAYSGSAMAGVASTFASISPTGAIAWEYVVLAYNDSSPNIAPDGSLYIGDLNGTLYKIGNGSGLSTSEWPRFQANRQQTGLRSDGEVRQPIDYFPAIASSQDGWAVIPWFGNGAVKLDALPLMEHGDLGLLYFGDADRHGAWFFDMGQLAWVFATASANHHYFNQSSQSWMVQVSTPNMATGRWFFDLTNHGWVFSD